MLCLLLFLWHEYNGIIFEEHEGRNKSQILYILWIYILRMIDNGYVYMFAIYGNN